MVTEDLAYSTPKEEGVVVGELVMEEGIHQPSHPVIQQLNILQLDPQSM